MVKEKQLFILPFLFILIILASACTQTTTQTTTTTIAAITGREVSFATGDGVKIFATYWDRGTENKLVLLHMLGRDRSDWNSFAGNIGYTVIAIDFRGHGQSDGNWQSFQEGDFSNMILDVKAASEFLGGQVIVIGASIGANVALNYADNYGADGVVLLSPSYDYRGVDTRAAITRYKGPLLIVTSRNDEQSYNPSITMHNTSPSEKKQLKAYEDAGHGTRMFVKEDLDDMILQFVENV